jgi:hypothetical protein
MHILDDDWHDPDRPPTKEAAPNYRIPPLSFKEEPLSLEHRKQIHRFVHGPGVPFNDRENLLNRAYGRFARWHHRQKELREDHLALQKAAEWFRTDRPR